MSQRGACLQAGSWLRCINWRSEPCPPPPAAAANGWEGHVLRGFAPLLERADRPPVVAVEWNPAAMRAAGWRKPLKLVEWCDVLTAAGGWEC